MAGDVRTAGSAGSEVTQAAGGQEQKPAAVQTTAPAEPATPPGTVPASRGPASTGPASTAPAGAVVRRRLARLGASRAAAVNPVLEPLF